MFCWVFFEFCIIIDLVILNMIVLVDIFMVLRVCLMLVIKFIFLKLRVDKLIEIYSLGWVMCYWCNLIRVCDNVCNIILVISFEFFVVLVKFLGLYILLLG